MEEEAKMSVTFLTELVSSNVANKQNYNIKCTQIKTSYTGEKKKKKKKKKKTAYTQHCKMELLSFQEYHTYNLTLKAPRKI